MSLIFSALVSCALLGFAPPPQWITPTPQLPLCTPQPPAPTSTSIIPTRGIPTVSIPTACPGTCTPGPTSPAATATPQTTATATPAIATPTSLPPDFNLWAYGWDHAIDVPGGQQRLYGENIVYTPFANNSTLPLGYNPAHLANGVYGFDYSGAYGHYNGDTLIARWRANQNYRVRGVGYVYWNITGTGTTLVQLYYNGVYTSVANSGSYYINSPAGHAYFGISAYGLPEVKGTLSYHVEPFTARMEVSFSPLASMVTPSPTPAPTATATPAPLSCRPLSSLGEEGLRAPYYVEGGCQTLLPGGTLDFPSVPFLPTGWTLPASFEMPGARFCARYLVIQGSLWGSPSLEWMITIGMFIVAVALVVDEFRS